MIDRERDRERVEEQIESEIGRKDEMKIRKREKGKRE